MILAKSFSVHVEPVQKTSTVLTSERPFFEPEKIVTSTSSVQTTSLVTQPSVISSTGTSPVQATGQAGSFTANPAY